MPAAQSKARADSPGIRVHKYRSLVLAALVAQPAPVSAQSLHALLRASDQHIGLSTVYRELHALTGTRHVAEAFVGGETVYRVSERDLLICDDCGRTEELAARLIPRGVRDGFFGRGRPVTIHGTCRLCAQAD